MNIIIHRNGFLRGSCVEVQLGGDRILLDLGMPLPKFDKSQREQLRHRMSANQTLPPIDGLYAESTPGVRAVVVSHAHPDHIGFTPWVHSEIPVFATQGTWALFDVSQLFQSKSHAESFANRRAMPKNKRIRFGNLVVTAIPVDHSAPDAVALLVKGGGKRVLYSGDLRAHGRKAYLWERLKNYDFKGRLDALLMEGTNIGRLEGEAETEQSLEEKLVRDLKHQNHIALVFCSPQNVDRIVTIYRAAKRLGRNLVIDLYAAYVLHALRDLSPHIPQWEWPLVRVVAWRYQEKILAAAGQQSFIERTRCKRIGVKELRERQNNLIFLARSNPTLKGKIFQNIGKAKVYWALWNGYWEEDNYARELCEAKGYEWSTLHTSGHASWKDLKELASALQPKTIIPIHTNHADRFSAELPNVKLPTDGAIIVI